MTQDLPMAYLVIRDLEKHNLPGPKRIKHFQSDSSYHGTEEAVQR
jgi:hypothetical protein